MVGIPEHIVVGIDPRSLKSKTGSKSAIFLQNYPANNKLLSDLQWESEHSEIGRRLLESSYNFKKSNKHEIQQMCSVSRPIFLNFPKLP